MSTPESFEGHFIANHKKNEDLFIERNAIYKNGWERSGNLMLALFPDGVELRTEEDFARYGLVEMQAAKLSRYCTNFSDGGHPDSQQDLSNYANILFTYDEEINRL